MAKKMYGDNTELKQTYDASAIVAYLNDELSAADLQASLGCSRASMYRRISRFKEHGIAGLNSGKIGNRNRAFSKGRRARILKLVRTKYPDFGPQFASEKLAENDGVKIGAATLRNWMIEEGIWASRQSKAPRIFQHREPRQQRGELIQVDGSYHRWFEKRGPECCLLVFIDDATSELMELRFVEHESSFNYMISLKRYIERHGKPLALYSDRHSIFRATRLRASGDRTTTQFSRSCMDLGVEIICAETPQAKGRVERANRTLQDRLVKELRLQNISTIDDANYYLNHYIKTHNERFVREALNPVDAHLSVENFDLDGLLTYSVKRKVFKDLSLSFNKLKIIITPDELSRKAIGQRVDVVLYLDGRLEVHFGEWSLPYRIFDKTSRIDDWPQVVDNKRLKAALDFGKAIQQVEPHHYKRNAHIMAGFRKFFPEPQDRHSQALREASPETHNVHNGRPRGPLYPHPVIICLDGRSEISESDVLP